MTTGERGRTPPDAEHYLDLPDAPEEAGKPHFDVVLRGYDRTQVDEHVAGLRRMVAQLRAQLAVRERRRPVPEERRVGGELAATLQEGSPAARAVTEADTGDLAEVPARPDDPDVVSAFNERLQGILAAAEQEAQMVRSKAAESLLAEHQESRAALADLRSQRDAVFDELVRVKNRLDDLVSNSGRPSQPFGASPQRGWGPSAPRGPRPAYGPPPPFVPAAPPAPARPAPEPRTNGSEDTDAG